MKTKYSDPRGWVQYRYLREGLKSQADEMTATMKRKHPEKFDFRIELEGLGWNVKEMRRTVEIRA